jgi:hypothetical protein
MSSICLLDWSGPLEIPILSRLRRLNFRIVKHIRDLEHFIEWNHCEIKPKQ